MESFDPSLKYLLQHEPADFIRFGLGDPSVQVLEPVPRVLPARGRVPARVMQACLSEGRLIESALYKSIFEKGEANGEAIGEAKAYADVLVRVPIQRIGVVDAAVRERIRGVLDTETLKIWCDEALLARDADAARRLADKIRNAPPT